MKVQINNHHEIIDRLNKLTFVKRDGNKLISEEGFALSWTYKLHSTSFNPIDLPSIQLIISVQYNEALITSWGCSSNDDTADFINFIVVKKAFIREYEYVARDNAEEEGKDLFNNL